MDHIAGTPINVPASRVSRNSRLLTFLLDADRSWLSTTVFSSDYGFLQTTTGARGDEEEA
jgi:hypothetical protein